MQVGTYEVTAELSGFKRFVRTGLELNVNDRLRVDVRLDTGTIDETITVVGQTPLVRTQDAAIGTLIPGSQVERMPLNGRNVINSSPCNLACRRRYPARCSRASAN